MKQGGRAVWTPVVMGAMREGHEIVVYWNGTQTPDLADVADIILGLECALTTYQMPRWAQSTTGASIRP